MISSTTAYGTGSLGDARAVSINPRLFFQPRFDRFDGFIKTGQWSPTVRNICSLIVTIIKDNLPPP